MQWSENLQTAPAGAQPAGEERTRGAQSSQVGCRGSPLLRAGIREPKRTAGLGGGGLLKKGFKKKKKAVVRMSSCEYVF